MVASSVNRIENEPDDNANHARVFETGEIFAFSFALLKIACIRFFFPHQLRSYFYANTRTFHRCKPQHFPFQGFLANSLVGFV